MAGRYGGAAVGCRERRARAADETASRGLFGGLQYWRATVPLRTGAPDNAECAVH
jgi:hypothetical protein